MRKKKVVFTKLLCTVLAATSIFSGGLLLTGCGETEDDVIELRVANWEEYIDLGDWDEEEVIELEDGTVIFGENSMIDDFEEWFYDTYGKRVKVSYSTFGTCEELYNQITIGDTFDLAAPSEYMIMKMMREDMVLPYSEEFKNTDNPENYYTNGVSPYIANRLSELSIEGMALSDYAACYMWGTLGIVYNPEMISTEEAENYNVLWNPAYKKNVTIKDSVRDSYFAALAVAVEEEVTKDSFLQAEDYYEQLSSALNRTDVDTVNQVEKLLRQAKKNVYSFETDSGKADMVTGKVFANLQWSGDAVYTIDQAEEDGVELCYATPTACTNLWFDGWIMLKEGIGEDADKQMAAEAFVNYLSKPENAVRNMYYIGYTSSISGGDSDVILEYMDWCYGAEEDAEDVVEYPVAYFFTGEADDPEGDYIINTTEDQLYRQFNAQYPRIEVMERAVVMACFDDADNERINQMWTNVRCFDIMEFFRGEN